MGGANQFCFRGWASHLRAADAVAVVASVANII